MKKIGIISCSLVVLVVIGGSFVAAGASTSATTRVLTVIRRTTDVVWQGNPDAPAVGDRFEFTSQLIKSGDVVGHQSSACTVVQASDTHHTILCEGTWKLPGGSISTQAYVVIDGSTEVIAITGGTGIYRAARGQVDVEPLGGSRQKVTFALT